MSSDFRDKIPLIPELRFPLSSLPVNECFEFSKVVVLTVWALTEFRLRVIQHYSTRPGQSAF